MEKRIEVLNKLRSYTEEVNNDLTMVLQSLQWDRKHIFQHSKMVLCKYDSNHSIPSDRVDEHEQECLLRQNGYVKEDKFFPDPLYVTGNTLVKLGKDDINVIINTAGKSDPTFKRVCVETVNGPKLPHLLCILIARPVAKSIGEKLMELNFLSLDTNRKMLDAGDLEPQSLEPQTLERLQCAYTMDERRAIYDTVVKSAPSYNVLGELALPSIGEDGKEVRKTKSFLEIMAELRDMRRRRTKYRVATKSKNYSDVLRDVIKTQMELYNEVIGEVETKPNVIEHSAQTDKQIYNELPDDNQIRGDNRHRTVFDRRDESNERYKKERNEKDIRNNDNKYNDGRDRDYSNRNVREMSRETQHHRRRYNTNHSSGDREVTKVHNGRYRDRSEGRQDRDHRYKERYTERHGDRQIQNREHNERERDHGRSIERYKIEKEGSDTERARKLITETKSEINLIDQVDIRVKEKVTGEINHRKHDMDNNYQRHKRDDSGHKHSDNAQNRSDRSKDDRKRHKDRRKSDVREYNEEHSRYKDSHRDLSYKGETKRSRVADKHKAYYEIYAELDKRRNK